MNIKSLITALVIGSSTVAMAAPSHFQTASERSLVRDHRTSSQPPRPIFPSALRSDRDRPIVTTYTAPVPGTEDCSNWDPTLSGNCGRETAASTRVETPWTSLGSRDSSISDHQYITVEQQFRQLRLESLTGRPDLDKVAIRYIDGSTQVVDLVSGQGCVEHTLDRSVIRLERKEISQVVMYTASGSRGTYSVYAV